MAKGDVRSISRRRKPRAGEVVAKRVVDFCSRDVAPATEAVQPLNPGFFTLERMRAQNVRDSKLRAGKRAKLKGK